MRYFYHHNEQVIGPVDIEELREKFLDDELSPETLCCPEGEESWSSLNTLFVLESTAPLQPTVYTATPPPLPEYKKCPFCAEEVRIEAKKCRHCGSPLVSPSPQDIQRQKNEQIRLQRFADGKFNCPQCGSIKTDCNKDVGCAIMIIIFISLGLGLIMIPFLPYSCSCNACGHKWKT